MNITFFLLPKIKVEFLLENFSLRQAIEKMEYHRYSVVPVLSKDGKYLYSLSEGDILYAMTKNKLKFEDLTKIHLESIERDRDVKPVSINSSMDDLVKLIVDQNFVPVVDDRGVFIGIITRKAVINYLLSK
ncbi:MAG: CBS domain-containing protein [Candidatus Enteromonas sp.]|nr:CBS domain-containing protein [Mollicutes bacterium]MDD7714448.1 CBS domain-containing protein [Mollicutes bacterium]MDY4936490.1 CBS domain-containing protein [Candidatus Enteromonas sp.]